MEHDSLEQDSPLEKNSPLVHDAPPVPFWRRAPWVFYAPARLGDELARHPRWVGAVLLGAALVVVSTLLIPAELWQEMMREQMMAAGQEAGAGATEMGATVFRISAVVGGAIFWFIWTLLLAGVAAVAFGFILGDEGRYRQYLAATSHALLIAAVGGLLTVPLRIAGGNPQLTLNVGTFFGDLGSGYLARFAAGLDLFMLWSVFVLAVIASRLDKGRSVASAATVLYVLVLALTALFALIPRPV